MLILVQGSAHASQRNLVDGEVEDLYDLRTDAGMVDHLPPVARLSSAVDDQ